MIYGIGSCFNGFFTLVDSLNTYIIIFMLGHSLMCLGCDSRRGSTADHVLTSGGLIKFRFDFSLVETQLRATGFGYICFCSELFLRLGCFL